MIGPAGAHIKSLMDRSGARLQLAGKSAAENAPKERLVTVTGAPTSCKLAVAASLALLVDEASPDYGPIGTLR